MHIKNDPISLSSFCIKTPESQKAKKERTCLFEWKMISWGGKKLRALERKGLTLGEKGRTFL